MKVKAHEIAIEAIEDTNLYILRSKIVDWLEANPTVVILGIHYLATGAHIVHQKSLEGKLEEIEEIDLPEDKLPVFPQGPVHTKAPEQVDLTTLATKESQVVKVLKEMDINFVEKANGHILIYDNMGKVAYQYWATTEKIIEQHTNVKAVGLHRLLRALKDRRDKGFL